MSKMQQGWLHHLIQPMPAAGCGGTRPANSYKSDLLKGLLMSKMQQGWLHHLIQPMPAAGCGGTRPENSFAQVGLVEGEETFEQD